MSRVGFNSNQSNLNRLLFNSEDEGMSTVLLPPKKKLSKQRPLAADTDDPEQLNDEYDEQPYDGGMSDRNSIEFNSPHRPIQPAERNFYAQKQCINKFPQVMAPSVEFSQSDCNISKHDKKSPFKSSEELNHENEVLRRKINKKEEEERCTDIVLDEEIPSLVREINKKDAEKNIYKAKFEKFERDLQLKQKQIQEGVLREAALQDQLDKARDLLEEQRQKLEKKDELFMEFQRDYQHATKIVEEHQKTIKQLKGEQAGFINLLAELGHTEMLDLGRFQQLSRKSSVFEQPIKKHQSVRNFHQINKFQEELENWKSKYAQLEDKYTKANNNLEELAQNYQDAEQQRSILQTELKKKEFEMKDRERRQNKEYKERENIVEKMQEMEKRIKVKDQQIKVLEGKVKDNMLELTDRKSLMQQLTQRNKSLQSANKLIAQLKEKNDLETHKYEEQRKQLNTQIKELRGKLQQKSQDRQKVVKKQQDKIDLLKKDVARLEKDAEQHQNIVKEQKKKLDEATKKAALAKARINQLQEQLNQTKAQLAAEKEATRKLGTQVNEAKKKSGESELVLANKIKILESRINAERQIQSNKQVEELSDRLETLEEILHEKQQEIEQLNEALKHAQQQSKNNTYDTQMRELLEQKQAQIQNYRRELELREKTFQFMHNKLMKTQRQKLQLQAEARIFQSNICQTDSQLLTEGDADSYSNRATFRRDKVQYLEHKIKILEEINQQGKKSKADLKDSSTKVEVMVLKNRVKELTDLLNKVCSDNSSKKIPPESLSPEQTLQFLLQTLKRVNKSNQMIRLLNKSTEFVELLKNMDKKKDELVYTRRQYA